MKSRILTVVAIVLSAVGMLVANTASWVMLSQPKTPKNLIK